MSAKQKTIEEQEMEDSLNESISQGHKMTVGGQNRAVTQPVQGIGIAGIDVPASMMPIPFLRLIQPTSQKTEDGNGKEVMPGNFLFNDTLKPCASVDFALLRSKVDHVTFERDGKPVTAQKLGILGMQLPENKLFILSLSVMSFSNFGRLIAQLKDAKITQAWRFKLTVSSEKRENAKGKFYVAKFQINEELDQETINQMTQTAAQYGGALDRQMDEAE